MLARLGCRFTLIALLGLASAASTAAAAAALETSRGVYRIPYANGTKVKVTNDHVDHDPIGRIDMSGREGSGEYKIVAAADGVVRAVVDNFSKRKPKGTRKPGEPCENNYVWIEHDNGEWTKYSHMKKDSSTKKAKLSVDKRVTAGTYLGDEGDVGCASGPHLHFEVGVPRATNPLDADGFLADNDDSERNRIPRVCNIPGRQYKSDTVYTAESVPGNLPRNRSEVATHGLALEDYQCWFDQMVDAGYEPSWLDMFNASGKTYVNAIAKPASGQGSAFHDLNGTQYQTRYNDLRKAGYRPVVLDSYLKGSQVRYAGFFKKASGPDIAAYHGLSASAHQDRLDDLKAKGFRPQLVSVVSAGGQLSYTAVYEKGGSGSWQLKSQIRLADYQSVFDDNKKAGRRPVALNGYNHGGQAYLAAVFETTPAGGLYKHGLSHGGYQSEWQGATKSGLRTRVVTGYDEDGRRYAAVWR